MFLYRQAETLAIHTTTYQHPSMTQFSTEDNPGTVLIDPADLSALQGTETWIFDLDNTLYPASCRLFDQVERNMTRFIQNLLSCERDEAYQVQKTYFREHGTTMSGLMHHHNVEPHDFLSFVHNINLSDVPVSAALDQALGSLPGRKIIFTNGSTDHADNITGHLGIKRHFDAVFDIIAANFIPKPARSVYEQLIKLHEINPETSVMVEDMAVNLRPAAELGMTTVWVKTESSWGTRDSDGDHIHHVVEDLAPWLGTIATAV